MIHRTYKMYSSSYQAFSYGAFYGFFMDFFLYVDPWKLAKLYQIIM